MQELRPGLWTWEARHPEWETADVRSYAVDDGTHLILFDPLSAPRLVDEIAEGRAPVIVITSTWHLRDANELSQRLGARIYSPEPDREPDPVVGGTIYRVGERLPFGVQAFSGREDPYDLNLYVESHRALVSGDTLLDLGDGLELRSDWLPDGADRGEVLAKLRRLLDLPIELVLPTHGAPTDRAALERALAA